MEGRGGGCCIAKYAGEHVASYDASNIDRIMMKYRPIAPKPAANTAAPASSDGRDAHAKAAGGGRGRRKCSSRRKRKSCSPHRTAKNASHHRRDHHLLIKAEAITLPLLPEAPDLSPTSKLQAQPMLSLNNNNNNNTDLIVGNNYNQRQRDRTATMLPRQESVLASYLIVEGITDTWTDYHQVMKRRLEEDKCPGLITDAWNRVWWTNEAYRRMVLGDTRHDQKMTVWVMMKEKVPDTLQAFTCRVRVQQSLVGEESRGSSSSSNMRVPCDVWRIDGGGWFAWRLDVDAALSLSLGR